MENNLIFAINRVRGIEFLENLIDELKYKDINRIIKSNSEYMVEIKDGTIYRVVSVSDSSRGSKGNKAFVEIGIDTEIINCVIRPCLWSSDLPEAEQIIYF